MDNIHVTIKIQHLKRHFLKSPNNYYNYDIIFTIFFFTKQKHFHNDNKSRCLTNCLKKNLRNICTSKRYRK